MNIFITDAGYAGYYISLLIVVGYFLSGVTCWLAHTKRKVLTLVLGVPSLALAGLIAWTVHAFFGWLPLLFVLYGIGVAIFGGEMQMKSKASQAAQANHSTQPTPPKGG